jgi:hypothetical protein
MAFMFSPPVFPDASPRPFPVFSDLQLKYWY